jgi:hypothetical protein
MAARSVAKAARMAPPSRGQRADRIAQEPAAGHEFVEEDAGMGEMLNAEC